MQGIKDEEAELEKEKSSYELEKLKHIKYVKIVVMEGFIFFYLFIFFLILFLYLSLDLDLFYLILFYSRKKNYLN